MTSSDIFEGIAAVSQLGMFFVVAAGVWVAYEQLHVWRKQDLQKKKAEIAEELLAASLEVSDILRALRTPFDSIPESERTNDSYIYETRLKGFNEASDHFSRLRRAQIRAEASIGDAMVNKAVTDLFDVRHETIVAIQMLSGRKGVYGDEDAETRNLYTQMKRAMWGTYSEKYDPLGMKQVAAIETLKAELTPYVRYIESNWRAGKG